MGSKQPLLAAYVLSAVAVVAAALGSLLVMETATIKVSVPTSMIVAERTIAGGPSSQYLTTTLIQADVSDSQQGTTSTAQIPPAYATGQVVFTCNPCPANPTNVPAGTGVSTATNPAIHFVTLSAVPLTATGSGTADVRALVIGPGGNTSANTVTLIDHPMPNVKVTNPKPIAGGADATTAQVVQQSDLDRVRTTLTARVTLDLNATLAAQAGGLSFVPYGEPLLKVDTDHKVGDRVATFTMTISATLGGVAFSQSQADGLMRSALAKKLPSGFQLTTDPVQTSYLVQQTSPDGSVTLKGSAIGVIVPNVTPGQLKARVTGLRVDAAREKLEAIAPGTSVDISVKPGVPWLPLIQDHINLTIVLLPASAGGL